VRSRDIFGTDAFPMNGHELRIRVGCSIDRGLNVGTCCQLVGQGLWPSVPQTGRSYYSESIEGSNASLESPSVFALDGAHTVLYRIQ
jgi:hypothetical protein